MIQISIQFNTAIALKRSQYRPKAALYLILTYLKNIELVITHLRSNYSKKRKKEKKELFLKGKS